MSALMTRAQQAASTVGNQIQHTSNRILPPEQRQQKINELRAFASHNPKLAGFLAAQALLIGTPLLIFLIFASSTLLISLVTCVLLGIFMALTISLTIIGFALLFLIPTLFVASIAACFVFGWTVAGYSLLRRFYDGERSGMGETRSRDMNRNGYKTGRLTGGRVAFGWGGDAAEDTRGSGEVGAAPDVPGQNVGKAGQGSGGAKDKQNGRYVNGVEGWDEKWRDGVEKNVQALAKSGDSVLDGFDIVRPRDEVKHS